MELIASTTVAVLVAGVTGGFSWLGAFYVAGSFIAILILAFVIHLLLSPATLDKEARTEVERLNGIIWELTKNRVIFEVSTMIRNSAVLLTDPGDTEDWRDAAAFCLEAKLFIRFFNDDLEAVRIYSLRLSIVDDDNGKEWPLTLHLMPPTFRKPNAQENEYFQGLVVGGKELTDYYWFQFLLDVPKDCALAVHKNCYLRVSLDAGKQDTYLIDLMVNWKGAREREVDVQNRNPEAEINCL